MNKIIQKLTATLIISSICICTLQAQKKSLFNKKNLDGWIKYGTEKWYVQDGDLISESGSDQAYGYLGTEKQYKNFILTLEFKQESNGNSGVFIRSKIEGTRVQGWQVEVAPQGLHTGGVYESYGRGWLILPDSEKEKALKEGEWNKMKIQVEGSKIITWLNGIQMIEIDDETIGKGEGRIALQIHDGGGIKVRWRKIRIKEL